MIKLVKKSIRIWLPFKQILENGVDRTTLLQKIITKATEKGDNRIIQSKSSQVIANTFIEAWEEILVECEGSSHILEIEYICSQCQVQFTTSPYVEGSLFVCIKCHTAAELHIYTRIN